MWESWRFHRSQHHREPLLMLLWKKNLPRVLWVCLASEHPRGYATLRDKYRRKMAALGRLPQNQGICVSAGRAPPCSVTCQSSVLLAKLLQVDQIRGNVKEVTEQTTGELVGRFQVLSLAFCNVSRLWCIPVLCKSEQCICPKQCCGSDVQPRRNSAKQHWQKVYNHTYCTYSSC